MVAKITPCLLGLGSNIGDRERFLQEAWKLIGEIPEVNLLQISSYYVTDPVGGPLNQEKFLNAVGKIETNLKPQVLLCRLQRIERDLGRLRMVHWGPRTIDIDILLFGKSEMNTETLMIPHPRMAERHFVLEPAVEIAPDFPYGHTGLTVQELWNRLKL